MNFKTGPIDTFSKLFYGVLLLLAISVLVLHPAGSGAAAPPVLYVGYTGNAGDTAGGTTYTCTGTLSSSTDHTMITNALAYAYNNKASGYTTVYLKGPHTYYVPSEIVGPNTGITLSGDEDAVITFTSAARSTTGLNLIDAVNGANHIAIRNITLDGGHPSASSLGDSGNILVQFNDVSYLTIDNTHQQYGDIDGMNIRTSDHITITNNTAMELGHECFYFLTAEYVLVENNVLRSRTNSCVRLSDGIQHADVRNNVFYSVIGDAYSGPLVQIGSSATSPYFNDIEVNNNKFYNGYASGIWLTHASGGTDDTTVHGEGVYIHHNTFTYTGHYDDNGYSNSGISIMNFQNTRIEHNVFDDCGQQAIAWEERDTRPASGVSYTTYVRNNIIMNTALTPTGYTNSGYGIANIFPRNHFVVENNCFYNNVGDTYSASGSGGFTSTNNIHGDPAVYLMTGAYGSRDYHLKSTAGRWTGSTWTADTVNSICIDTGKATMPYSLEPQPNGARANIGRYGNTAEASKSASGAVYPYGTFTANPTSITAGESSNLIWTSTNAVSASISGVGAVTPVSGGAVAVYPTASTTYTLTLTNAEGSTYYYASVTVGNETPPEAPVTVADSRIKSTTPDNNFGTGTYLDLGQIASTGAVYRDLLYFNLTSYDPEDIGYATLDLWWYYPAGVTRNNDTDIKVYKVVPAESWTQSQVTWNSRLTGTAWTYPGGDYQNTLNYVNPTSEPPGYPFGNYTINAEDIPINGYISIDVTDLVQSFATYPQYNKGFFLKAGNEHDNYIAFYSSENGNASRAPKLSIYATAPNPKTIESYAPGTASFSWPKNTIKAFNVTTNTNTSVVWTVDGNLRETDTTAAPGYAAGYDFVSTTNGTYTVKAETDDDFVEWEITIYEPETLNIIETSPAASTTLPHNSTRTFSASTNKAANYYWYYNGIAGNTAIGATSDSYTWGTGMPSGYYTIMLYVIEGAESDSYEWSVEVLEDGEDGEPDYYEVPKTGYSGYYTETANDMNYTTPFTLSQTYTGAYLVSGNVTITDTVNKYIRFYGLGAWSNQWDSVADNPVSLPHGMGNLTQLVFSAYNLSTFDVSALMTFNDTDLTTEETRASGQLNVSMVQAVLLDSTNGTIIHTLADRRFNGVAVNSFSTNNTNAEYVKNNGVITITTGPQSAGESKYYNFGFTIPPIDGFQYWDGEMWYTGDALDYLYFDAFWWANLVPNYAQNSTQPTLKITNTGGSSGTPYLYLDRDTPATIDIWVDNDPIKGADSIKLSSTPQAVNTALAPGENVTLWAWCGLYGAESERFSLYADVS